MAVWQSMSHLSVCRCLWYRDGCCSSGSAGSCLRSPAHHSWEEEQNRFCSSAWPHLHTERHTPTTLSTLTSDHQLQVRTGESETKKSITSDIVDVKDTSWHHVQRTDLDMHEGNSPDCQTELHHRPLLAELPSVCLSAETRSPDRRTHCKHSTLSTGTWCSPLEEREGNEMRWDALFSLIITFEVGILYILPQSFSSDPSTQSFCRSHLRSRWTHSPLAQENCFVEQGLGTSGPCVVTAGLTVVPDKTHEQNNRTLFNFHKYLSKNKR